jgi:hypothetical protein
LPFGAREEVSMKTIELDTVPAKIRSGYVAASITSMSTDRPRHSGKANTSIPSGPKV